MTQLPRLYPDPVPAIHPLPEYQASGQVARWYGEVKAALQVPWMGVVTMAYAHYPTFFAELWRGLKPLVASAPFVEAFQENRSFIEAAVTELEPPPIAHRLAAFGYAPREVEGIRAVVEVFSHGNHPYALIATVARLLMEGGEMAGIGEAPAYEGRHAPKVSVPFVLMEAHHADAPTRAVYDDVKRVLGLPFVNTDYRAFARWPSYFDLAWADLAPHAGSPAHEAFCRAYHERMVDVARSALPNPGGLSPVALRKAADADAPLEEVLAVCRLFQWLLPGLATNVAFFRHQLLHA
ncbi:MAG: halocarboxylic acid dehydrogenase DehI family protein [Rhodospirillales bacterium]|nr:halocarboxylic acid dehydrogenase DehI family protein [Rhodospirillales bacterium]